MATQIGGYPTWQDLNLTGVKCLTNSCKNLPIQRALLGFSSVICKQLLCLFRLRERRGGQVEWCIRRHYVKLPFIKLHTHTHTRTHTHTNTHTHTHARTHTHTTYCTIENYAYHQKRPRDLLFLLLQHSVSAPHLGEPFE